MMRLGNAKGYTVSQIKRARELGCPGLDRTDRIYWDECEEWFSKNRESLLDAELTDITSLRAVNIALDNELKRVQIEREKGRTIDRSELDATQKMIFADMRNIIYSLPKEYPAKLAGLSIPELTTELENIANTICGKLQKLDELTTPHSE